MIRGQERRAEAHRESGAAEKRLLSATNYLGALLQNAQRYNPERWICRSGEVATESSQMHPPTPAPAPYADVDGVWRGRGGGEEREGRGGRDGGGGDD